VLIFEPPSTMAIKQTLIFLLMACVVQAQHKISGTFTPAEDYTWVIAYRIMPGTQAYMADTAVNNGTFTLTLPPSAEPGTYRLVYAVPQEQFYFDVLYDGKEDVRLNFDAQNGPTYSLSEENKIYNSYFKEITGLKQLFIDFYKDGNTDRTAFEKLIQQSNQAQTAYEESTKGMLVHEFIVANRPYIPADYETEAAYWQNKKDHYFDFFDLKNPTLQASGFLTDRVNGYVFTAITTTVKTKAESERVFRENIKTVNGKLEGTDPMFRQHVLYGLWSKAASFGFDDTSDYIYNTYLKTLANRTNNQKIIDDIDKHNRLRIGAKAPEILWQEGAKTKKLSELDGADCYILIFWSSTCSHCLSELPPLHKKMASFKNVKVIAVGMEDDDVNWKLESAKLSGFEHALALGKWDSNYAKSYAISQTPTYFVLDKDKHIIAKPENDKVLVQFLSQ
jgi:peroxiredoxin